MTHVFNDEGSGSSENSLMEAISNAVANALAEIGLEGDHMASVTVIVDSAEFNGEEYVAKVRVSVLDFNLAEEDVYHELEAEFEERRENSEAFATAFFASAYAPDTTHNPFEHAEDLEGQLEGNLNEQSSTADYDFGEENGSNIYLYATPEVHEQLAQEVNEQKQEQKLKNDFPSLDLGGGGGSHSERGEAA